MQITTVMVVVFLIWCGVTLLMRGPAQTPPVADACQSEIHGGKPGMVRAGRLWTIPMVAVIIAFGHSLLSMSGFETLAQVYREIASPKLKNLKITGNIVCIYAIVCTGGLTLLAVDDHSRRASGRSTSTIFSAAWRCTSWVRRFFDWRFTPSSLLLAF